MLRGLYSAATGMIAQQRKHDAVTNNIANIETPGYKASTVVSRSFPEMLIRLVSGDDPALGGHPRIGRLNTGVLAEESIRIFTQGDLQETNNPFDLALVYLSEYDPALPAGLAFDGSGRALGADGETYIKPDLFFTVLDHNDELRYTRNGKFTLSTTGELITSEGYRVADANGQPISLIGLDPATFEVMPNGQFIDRGTGDNLPIALGIARVANPNMLIAEGQSLYRLDDENVEVQLAAGNEVLVKQGFIEHSSVDPVQSMVDMMSAMRAYEANQKVIQFYDASLDKAVNEVGRV